jgi:hypothetical protein
MLEIEAGSVVNGEVISDNLVLTTFGGDQIIAGNVRGLKGDAGPPVDEVAIRAYADTQDGLYFDAMQTWVGNQINTDALGAGVDLNNMTTTGAFQQNATASATLALHYPSAIAGLLEVHAATTTMIYQRYTAYNGGNNRTWVRNFYSTSLWSAWFEVFVATPWINATLENAWVTYSTGFDVAQYRMLGDKVELRGLIKNGTATATMLTLPVGYRPLKDQIFICWSNTGFARVDVAAVGSVRVAAYGTGGSNVFVSLANLSFSIR